MNGAANDAASEGCEVHEIMKFTSLRNWEFPLEALKKSLVLNLHHMHAL